MIKIEYFICDDVIRSRNKNYNFLLNYNDWNVMENMGEGIILQYREFIFEILDKDIIINALKNKIDDNKIENLQQGYKQIGNYGRITIYCPDLTEEEIFYYILKYGKENLIEFGVIK